MSVGKRLLAAVILTITMAGYFIYIFSFNSQYNRQYKSDTITYYTGQPETYGGLTGPAGTGTEDMKGFTFNIGSICGLGGFGYVYVNLGWSTQPYLYSRVLGVSYTKTWDILDLYKSNTPCDYSQTETKTVSTKVGFKGSDRLTAGEAKKFGLKVSEPGTVEYSIPPGLKITVGAWTKMGIRPHIYYYTDTYMGVYDVAKLNIWTKEIVEINHITATAENVWVTAMSSRVWTAENTTCDPEAAAPDPPAAWEW